MLRALLNWSPLQHRFAAVQYEVQRMTPHGGWKNFHDSPDTDEPATFDHPPDEPSLDAATGYPPGRYRCIKRVDGRIDQTVWTIESPDADAYYAHQRAQARQRDELAEMSFEEVCRELDAREELEALDRDELLQAAVEKYTADSHDGDDDQGGLSSLEERLVAAVWAEDGSQEAIRGLKDLKGKHRSGCEYCDRTTSTTCPQCRSFVCWKHRDRQTTYCTSCL